MSILGEHRWIVFVLPGFIALFVASFISDFPEIRDSQLPIVYIALTLLSVAIPLLIVHIYGKVSRKGFLFGDIIRSPYIISSIFSCSVLLGFLFGVAHTTDYVSSGLRSVFGKDIILTSSHSELIKVLFRESYKDGFEDGQPHKTLKVDSTNRYARFRFSQNRESYEGVITSYFGGDDLPQVYLSPACLVRKDDVAPINGPGVWLNLEKVEAIQFIYDVCSMCATQIEIAAGNEPSSSCPFP